MIRPSLAIFTICARNYYPLARTLAQSVRRHHPDATIVLCAADEPGERSLTADFDQVIAASDLELPDFDQLAFRYTLMELSTAIKPAVFERLFSQGFRHVVYFDPDIVLYAPIAGVTERLDAGATTVLTPHALSPNEIEEPPNDRTFLQNGAYNLGFLALADGQDVRRLLAWWGRRLQRLCIANRLEAGLFVDQKWMDLWPSYCPDVHVLRHPGYNVAYWNLDTRVLAETADGRWTVDGHPLVFFHFSGIVPGHRRVLSKHQARWRPSSTPALAKLTADYHDALEANRNPAGVPEEYAYGRFRDGTPVPAVARWVFRDRLEPFHGDPFERMPQVLNEASPDVTPNPGGVVTRLTHHLWEARDDLRRAFSLTSAASQVQYARWFIEVGWRQAQVAAAFVDPIRVRLDTATAPAPMGLRAGLRSRLVRSAARHFGHYVFKAAPTLRPLYRWIRPEHRRRLVFAMFVRFGWPEGEPGGEIGQSAAGEPPPALEDGIAIVGYPFAETGVGEAMRALARSATAAGVPLDVYNFDAHVRARQDDRSVAALVTNRLTRRVNVFCVNADMAGDTARLIGAEALAGRYNIIRPFWELSRGHDSWVEPLRRFDEIWAPTTFVRDAFSALCEVPVFHVPVAVEVRPSLPDRARFRLPEEAFVFLCMFDMASYPARKNPEGAIRAFQRAFPSGGRVRLLIKLMGDGPDAPRARARLADEARRDPRILLIDETMARHDITTLTASCDAFVSLHRSEGFGFGLAEAMALGKPVIATDYSGTRDFLSADTGFPVACTIVPVRPGEYPYFIDGQVWAEPDLDHAARHMQRVVHDPAAASEIAARGRAFIAAEHSHETVGRRVRQRLEAAGIEPRPNRQ